MKIKKVAGSSQLTLSTCLPTLVPILFWPPFRRWSPTPLSYLLQSLFSGICGAICSSCGWMSGSISLLKSKRASRSGPRRLPIPLENEENKSMLICIQYTHLNQCATLTRSMHSTNVEKLLRTSGKSRNRSGNVRYYLQIKYLFRLEIRYAYATQCPACCRHINIWVTNM